jgi:hypothetical protein
LFDLQDEISQLTAKFLHTESSSPSETISGRPFDLFTLSNANCAFLSLQKKVPLTELVGLPESIKRRVTKRGNTAYIPLNVSCADLLSFDTIKTVRYHGFSA